MRRLAAFTFSTLVLAALVLVALVLAWAPAPAAPMAAGPAPALPAPAPAPTLSPSARAALDHRNFQLLSACRHHHRNACLDYRQLNSAYSAEIERYLAPNAPR